VRTKRPQEITGFTAGKMNYSYSIEEIQFATEIGHRTLILKQ
jgi:hypothetical protein